MTAGLVYLRPVDVAELSLVLDEAADHEQDLFLWVDGGGIRYSGKDQVWSLPLGRLE